MRCSNENSPTKFDPHAAATRISASRTLQRRALSTIDGHASNSCACERLKLRRVNTSQRCAFKNGRSSSIVSGGAYIRARSKDRRFTKSAVYVTLGFGVNRCKTSSTLAICGVYRALTNEPTTIRSNPV